MNKIKHDGDTWKILSEGTMRDGKIMCHLASTTRGRQQRNGWVPLQINDWIDTQVILAAAITQEEQQRRALTEQSLTRSQRYALERLAAGQSLRGQTHGVTINHLKMKKLIEDSDTITEAGRQAINSN